jgi:hypothetical protein
VAAEGEASRPTRTRSAMTSRWLMVSNRPVSRYRLNQRKTVLLGGRARKVAKENAASRFRYGARAVADGVRQVIRPPPLVGDGKAGGRSSLRAARARRAGAVLEQQA